MKKVFLKPLNLLSIIIMISILIACLKKEELVPMPVARFEEELFADFTVPTTITFNSLSENADSYLWTYPGGTSTDEDLTLNFKSAGKYTISLKVTNKAGSDSYSQTYTLVAPVSSTTPKASFSYSPNSNLVAPAKITFTNTSKNADTYKWDFGDGTTSTTVSPVKEFTKAGDYNVKLTATDAKNQSDQVISTVSVKPAVVNNDGTYTFFTKSDLKVGNIDVTVNNVLRGTITQYHTNGVTCGQGNVNVTLPAGTYAFSAKAGDGTTWSDKITFEKGTCKTQELTKSTNSGVNSGTNCDWAAWAKFMKVTKWGYSTPSAYCKVNTGYDGISNLEVQNISNVGIDIYFSIKQPNGVWDNQGFISTGAGKIAKANMCGPSQGYVLYARPFTVSGNTCPFPKQ